MVGNVPTTQHLPAVITDVLTKEPERILARKMVKRQNKVVTQVLVKWINEGEEEATWELLYDLQRQFPAFEPCGQGSFEGEDLL